MTPPPAFLEALEALLKNVQDYAIFILDTEGRIRSWNNGAEQIKGFTRDEVLGRHFSIFYPPDVRARAWPEYELRTAAAAGRFEDEGWRVRKDGEHFWANVVITAMRDDQGELRGFLKITRDLTERRRQDEVLRESEERFRLLVEGVKDYAICMLDREGLVRSWNAAAERILGYRSQEVIGRPMSLFSVPEDVAEGRPQQLLREALEEGHVEDEGLRVRQDGTKFWAGVAVTALYDADGQLRGFANITRDLSERQRSEALARAGQRMTEFLAMLSHELRNPLAPIRNAAAVLAADPVSSKDARWARDVIERQAGHLERLVDDLLDVSRVTLGKIHIEKAPLDLVSVIDQAMEASRPNLDARSHRVRVSVPADGVWVHGDLTRLSQVVLNLLNNAAKYTPDGGSVDVTLARDGDEAVIHVRDSGIGMTPELAVRAFEMFTQGEGGVERSGGGLGIGLTLSRRLTTLHGGSLTAQSEGPGMGSVFTVRLPLLPAPAAEPAAHGRVERGTPERARRILVVDDNRDSAESMAMILQLWGYGVRVAHAAVDALAAVATYRPQIALLDIGLPGMNGYELARRIRQLSGVGEKMYLVAVTGYGQEEDRRLSDDAGFDHHLVKPVNIEQLRRILLELASGRPREPA